jgi:hypothetical protein
VRHITDVGDLAIIVRFLLGLSTPNSARLHRVIQRSLDLAKKFDSISFFQELQSHNKKVNQLVYRSTNMNEGMLSMKGAPPTQVPIS